MGTSALNNICLEYQGVATSQEKQQQSWEMGLGCKWFLSVTFTPLLHYCSQDCIPNQYVVLEICW